MRNNNRSKGFSKISIMFLVIVFMSIFSVSAYADTTTLDEARSIISNYYVNKVPDSVLNAPTIDDMVNGLNDPYSKYFTAQEYSDFVNQVNMNFVGIGVGIDTSTDGILVTDIYQGSPAEKAGIQEGDIITQADGHNLAGLDLDTASGYIKGPEGTSVNLQIKRGDTYINMNVTRAQINLPTVEGGILGGHIGYIAVYSFGENTAADFGNVLAAVKGKNPDSYIIDLRDNGGGYLQTALDIEGYFIGKNVGLVASNRYQSKINYYSTEQKLTVDKPTIFLINENSASASEILSGAVKDYGKAFFMGNTSYGKGVMQSIFPLSDGSELKITTESFFTPKGNVINKVGISPDFKVDPESNIDSLLVAYIMSAQSGKTADKTGYERITIGNRNFEIDLSKARDKDFFEAFKYIAGKAISSGYNVEYGTKDGYKSFANIGKQSLESVLYPDYKRLDDITNAPVDKKFTITFSKPMDEKTIDNNSIELVDTSTGDRIPMNFNILEDGKIQAVPSEKLTPGESYYFVINNLVKAKNGASLSQGTISVVDVAK